MKHNILLIGGSHAHKITLKKLGSFIDKGHQVTVIQPSPHQLLQWYGTWMLGNTYKPDDIRFATQKLVERHGGTFLQAKTYPIDPDQQIVYIFKI